MVGVVDPHAKFECVRNVLFYKIISINILDGVKDS